MEAKYFKFMFQNVTDGIYYTGCLWNTYNKRRANFLYMNSSNKNIKPVFEQDSRFDDMGLGLDFLVISNLNLAYMNHLLKILKSRRVKTVIMPYFSPSTRMEVLRRYYTMGPVNDDVEAFWENPYYYLQRTGVAKIYLLHGNGRPYKGGVEVPGEYFQECDYYDTEAVMEDEAFSYTIYKAGYLVSDEWVFCFGNYQKGIDSAIVMYHGTMADDTKADDCVLNAKNFSCMHDCNSDITDKNSQCHLRCTYKTDYDSLKRQNRDNVKEYINGSFLLGNVRLAEVMDQFYEQFGAIKEKIRFVGVPNCGEEECWNKRMLGFGNLHNKCYWAVANNKYTSAEVIKDITTSAPYNSFALLNDKYGLCISGYLKRRSDIILPDSF
jgi:hypothetical protein